MWSTDIVAGSRRPEPLRATETTDPLARFDGSEPIEMRTEKTRYTGSRVKGLQEPDSGGEKMEIDWFPVLEVGEWANESALDLIEK